MDRIIYQFKIILKSKSIVFWMAIYPLILSSFFKLGFSNIGGDIEKIRLGYSYEDYVVESLYNSELVETVKIREDDFEEALVSSKISAYLNKDNKLIVSNYGLDTSILKEIIVKVKGGPFRTSGERDYVNVVWEKNHLINLAYYSLIGMFSIYSSYCGLEFATIYSGDLSRVGIRMNIIPTKKSRLILTSGLTSLLLNFTSNVALIFFMKYILKLGILNNLKASLLILLAANFFGVGLGMAIGSNRRLKYGDKTIILTISSLVLSTMAGMMNVDLKLKIEETVPILNRLNPINIITTSLYRYNNLGFKTGLTRDLAPLFLVGLVLILGAYYNLRRTSYDSI